MNPQMQKDLDVICKSLAEKLNTTTIVIQLFISFSLFNTKMMVIASTAQDPKIDIKGTLTQMSSELLNLLICIGQLVNPEPWDSLKVLSVEKQVSEAIAPVVQFYYFGVGQQTKENLQ